jgi:hypothetical protein
MLTTAVPNGAGLLPADLLTKSSIRRLEVGKGTSRKLYYPDYMVVLAGLPVLVVEAKAHGEALEQGLSEARLYANELNALFPSGINPCARVIACNGTALHAAPVDAAEPDRSSVLRCRAAWTWSVESRRRGCAAIRCRPPWSRRSRSRSSGLGAEARPFDAAGNLLTIAEMQPETRTAVATVKVVTRNLTSGDDRVDEVREVRFWGQGARAGEPGEALRAARRACRARRQRRPGATTPGGASARQDHLIGLLWLSGPSAA